MRVEDKPHLTEEGRREDQRWRNGLLLKNMRKQVFLGKGRFTRDDDVSLRSGPWHTRESLQKSIFRKDAVLLYLFDHFN